MEPHFQKPSAIENLFNRAFGALAAAGWAPKYAYLLQTRGRKSGKLYSTPVNLLEQGGKLYLVGARGQTAWSRNAEAAGEITLKRGKSSTRYAVRLVPDAERAPMLKAYLETWAGQVKRFFAVEPSAPIEAFAAIAAQHPVFELTRVK